MPKIAAIFRRFPAQELAIRRLCNRDPGFRSVCEDYDEAAAALLHWQEAGSCYADRTDEYRALLGKLEAEVMRALSDAPRPGSNQDN